MKFLLSSIRLSLVGLMLLTFGVSTSHAANKVLKIGHIGVMSGSAASWGLINKYAALAGAQIINEDGGFEIGGENTILKLSAWTPSKTRVLPSLEPSVWFIRKALSTSLD